MFIRCSTSSPSSYKTTIIWRKTGRKGIGYWFRGEAELLLFGICGPVRAFRSPLPNVIEAPVEGHSCKPAHFRHLIETYTPHQLRVELFARQTDVPGWTCHGLESDGIDLRDPFADGDIPIGAGLARDLPCHEVVVSSEDNANRTCRTS